MRNLRTKLAIAVVAAGAAATAFAISPANANSAGTGVVVGNGTISPGLDTTPAFQSVTFGGTLVAAGANGASTNGSGVYNCSFSGSSSIAETVAQGQGSVSGSCSGSAGSVSATVSYLRVGGDVVLTGTASGSISGSIAGDCSFEPTSAPKTTSYQLQCDLTIH